MRIAPPVQPNHPIPAGCLAARGNAWPIITMTGQGHARRALPLLRVLWERTLQHALLIKTGHVLHVLKRRCKILTTPPPLVI